MHARRRHVSAAAGLRTTAYCTHFQPSPPVRRRRRRRQPWPPQGGNRYCGGLRSSCPSQIQNATPSSTHCASLPSLSCRAMLAQVDTVRLDYVDQVQVWMSHGDEAVRLPDGFQSVATSEQVLLTEAWHRITQVASA